MSDDRPDLTLLAAWQGGDARAGETLFLRHFRAVYRFFETKYPTEADELVQATFLACVGAKERFHAGSSFRAYLFTVARHELYRVIRERHRAMDDRRAAQAATQSVSRPTLVERGRVKNSMSVPSSHSQNTRPPETAISGRGKPFWCQHTSKRCVQCVVTGTLTASTRTELAESLMRRPVSRVPFMPQ